MYRLTSLVPAVRYIKGQTAADVAALIASVAPGYSHSNMHGPLEFYNGGPTITVNDGDWVAIVAGQIFVFEDEQFAAHFAE
jgi:hypothetical protein